MCTSLWHAINSWREVPAHAEVRARSYSALPLPCGYAGTCLIQQTYISAWSGSFLYMQRKYCRSVLNHKDKMYKGFDVWLRKNYPEGKPTGLQLQSALAEDDAFFLSARRSRVPAELSKLYGDATRHVNSFYARTFTYSYIG